MNCSMWNLNLKFLCFFFLWILLLLQRSCVSMPCENLCLWKRFLVAVLFQLQSLFANCGEYLCWTPMRKLPNWTKTMWHTSIWDPVKPFSQHAIYASLTSENICHDLWPLWPLHSRITLDWTERDEEHSDSVCVCVCVCKVLPYVTMYSVTYL